MILQLFILFLIVIIGGAIGFYTDDKSKRYLKSALAFSASFILGITILHLIPMVYIDFEFSYGLWILGGFFVQILLETLSSGVEHGHIHSKNGASKSWAFQILIGLSFHAFIEGMPLMEMHGHDIVDHGHDHRLGSWNYFLSLVLHKLPAAYALVLLLKHSGFQKGFILGCLIVFGLMSPLGALLIQAFEFSNVVAFKSLMAFVIGAFLHIATTIMFETDSSTHHHISLSKVAFSLLGVGTAVLAELL